MYKPLYATINHMKPLFLFSLLFMTLTAAAQTRGGARLYGYRQPVVRGAAPDRVQEEGGSERATTRKEGNNYYLYLSAPARVVPQEMWINGTPYSVSYSPVPEKPVVLSRSVVAVGVEEITLVPQTGDYVWKLTPAPPVEHKLTGVGRKLSQGAGLVVVYRQGGKLYYSTLKELQLLDAASAM